MSIVTFGWGSYGDISTFGWGGGLSFVLPWMLAHYKYGQAYEWVDTREWAEALVREKPTDVELRLKGEPSLRSPNWFDSDILLRLKQDIPLRSKGWPEIED